MGISSFPNFSERRISFRRKTWSAAEAKRLKTNPETLRKAERFFHENIPLTRAMGLRVVADTVHSFAVEAPVLLNHNHLQTAFGGSIFSIATLAGYGLLWMELQGTNAQIVIGSSSIRFLRPVREMIRAVCSRPEDNVLKKFKATLRDHGKARISLSVQVIEGGETAAHFEASFVALSGADSR